jgi:hypothetical protein
MCRYVRRCKDCQEIIHLSFDRLDPICYACTIKKDEKQFEIYKELNREDFKCPCCGHEWVKYPELEPFDDE